MRTRAPPIIRQSLAGMRLGRTEMAQDGRSHETGVRTPMSTSETFSFISSRGPLGPADYRRAAERLGGVIDRLPYHDSANFLLRDIAGLLDHAADALPPSHPWDDKNLEELLEIAIDCGWSPLLRRTLDRMNKPQWLVSMGGGEPRAHVFDKADTPRAAVLAAMKQLEQEIRK